MVRRFSTNFAVLSIFADLLVVPAGLRFVVAIRPLLNVIPSIQTIKGQISLPMILYILFPLVWVFILAFTSIYDGKKNLRVVDELASLTQGSLLAAVSMAGILYFSYRDVSRALFLTFVVFTFILMIVWRLIARIFFRLVRRGLSRPQRVLIIGAGVVGKNMREQLLAYENLNLQFIGFLDDDPGKREAEPELVLGTLADIRNVVRNSGIDTVVIALPLRAHERTNQLAAELIDMPLKVWIIPDYFSITLHRAAVG